MGWVFQPHSDPECSECGEHMPRLVVPPVLNKNVRNYPLVRRIWNTAEAHIRDARELVIWGYSLPPTDFYAQWLLRQAPSHALERIAIINPNVNDDAFVGRFIQPHIPGVDRGQCRIDLYRSFSDFTAETPDRSTSDTNEIRTLVGVDPIR